MSNLGHPSLLEYKQRPKAMPAATYMYPVYTVEVSDSSYDSRLITDYSIDYQPFLAYNFLCV